MYLFIIHSVSRISCPSQIRFSLRCQHHIKQRADLVYTMYIREQCVCAVYNIQTYLARNTVCVYSKDQVINAVGNPSVTWNTSIRQLAPWHIVLSLQPVVLGLSWVNWWIVVAVICVCLHMQRWTKTLQGPPSPSYARATCITSHGLTLHFFSVRVSYKTLIIDSLINFVWNKLWSIIHRAGWVDDGIVCVWRILADGLRVWCLPSAPPLRGDCY